MNINTQSTLIEAEAKLSHTPDALHNIEGRRKILTLVLKRQLQGKQKKKKDVCYRNRMQWGLEKER